MNVPTCSCTDSDLLLAVHGALPISSLLRVQFHRLLCPVCRERYCQLSAVSRQLAGTLGPHRSIAPRPLVPLWGAALLCTLAMFTAAWSAYASLAPPAHISCEPTETGLATTEQCETSK